MSSSSSSHASSSVSSSMSNIGESLLESLTDRIRERARERLRETVLSDWSSRSINTNRSRIPPPSVDFPQVDGEDNYRGNGKSGGTSSLLDLPAITIRNIEEEIPKDYRNCVICFEDFKIGQKRKILECLHGFHDTCIDQWLRINSSCPICRH